MHCTGANGVYLGCYNTFLIEHNDIYSTLTSTWLFPSGLGNLLPGVATSGHLVDLKVLSEIKATPPPWTPRLSPITPAPRAY